VRVLKWVAWGFGGLVALAIVGVLVIVWVVDPNRFKPRIEAAVREATGRELVLVGDIDLGFYPWLALRSGAGSFANAPGFGPEPMVAWRRAQVGAKLLPLLRKQLVVDRVRLEGVDLRLIRHADGRANWQGIGPTVPAAERPPGEAGPAVTVDGIEITDSRVSFVDETVPRRIELTGLRLTTDEVAPDAPFTDTEIAGTLRMEGFAPEGVPLHVTVPEAVFGPDYSSIDVKEYALAFGVFEAEGAVRGTLAEPVKLQGGVTTNVFDLRALLAAVGIAAPKTTDPKALGRVALRGDWSVDAGAVAVKSLAFTLDDTRLTGHFTRRAGAGAVGEFELRGDAIDIARYVPPPDPASEPFVLPTAALAALAFRGVFELEQATYGEALMKGVTVRLLLDERGLRKQ
jgi:AsmA protein